MAAGITRRPWLKTYPFAVPRQNADVTDASLVVPCSLVVLCLCLVLLSGCAPSKKPAPNDGLALETQKNALPDAVTRSQTETPIQKAENEKARLGAAQRVIETAKTQIGRPYRYGGTSPATGFDCSGFVKWSFAQHGIKLPRTSREQLVTGIPVSRENIKPGDLMIFTRRVGSRSSTHAGIYVGEGKFIHSPSSGRTVCIEEAFDGHYGKRFIGARRVILNADEVKVYAAQQKKHEKFLASGAMHTVRRGQTVSGIARKYGVTVRAILQANNMNRSTVLQIGQKLHIPGSAGVAKASEKATVTFVSNDEPKSSASRNGTYVVKSGDNVWSIAKRFKVSEDAVLQANNLPRRHTLRVGQKLTIPGLRTETATASKQEKTLQTASAPSSTTTIPKGASCMLYVVKPGDSAWSVAKRHGVDTATLLSANGLEKNHVLRVGQKLSVPGTSPETEIKNNARNRTEKVTLYNVKSGDTIWSLARKYGVSTRSLLEANGLTKSSVLRLGQELRIPVASAE